MLAFVHNPHRWRSFDPGDGVMIVDWLRAAMVAHGVGSQRELAEIAGITEDQMSKVFKGKRRLTSAELLKISQRTGLALPESAPYGTQRTITYVKVVGEVAAGVWREVSFYDFDEYETPYSHDPRWPAGSVYGLIVRGESVNKLARDGDLALVLRLESAPRSYREDDMVVVERSRDGLVETTLKRVRRSAKGGWELWPESDDPAHQNPIPLIESDHDMIRVIGFVLDFMKPVTRFGPSGLT